MCKYESIHLKSNLKNKLEYLDLGECAFLTDSAVSAILSSAPNLRTLNLSLVSSLKGSFLLHHESLPHLRVLNLSHLKNVANESFCLRLAKVCRNLEELYLDGCTSIDNDCVASFIDDNLPKLKILSLNDCPLISKLTLDLAHLKYSST